MRGVNSIDPARFQELFKTYYTLLTAKAYEICSDWQMAEDAVQEFFADTWAKKNWHTIQNFAAYAARAVQYKTISQLRKLQRHNQYDGGEWQVSGEKWADAEKTENALQRELKLVDALNSLPPQQKEAFLLAHYHDKSYNEISTQMGVSINTIKTHLRLAMSRLREILAAGCFFLNFF